jgi:radical SAM superfamily enzyme YgiQ (UPF0313 family)
MLGQLRHPSVEVSELRPRTIFGGVVATPLADEVALHPSVDFVISGCGEHALPDLLDALQGLRATESVGGLVFQPTFGEPIVRNIQAKHMLVSALPFPKVDLFPSSTGENLRYKSRYGRHHHIYFGDETFTLYPSRLVLFKLGSISR